MTARLERADESAVGNDALARRLAQDLDGEVRFDDYSRHLFSRDASMYAIRPVGVVFPRHAEDVVAAVCAARDHGVSIVPRGAGTSLAGQTVGPGLVLDFSRHMNRILEIDPQARTALVGHHHTSRRSHQEG